MACWRKRSTGQLVWPGIGTGFHCRGQVDLVFDLVSLDVVSSQVDATVAEVPERRRAWAPEAKCWPVRIDLSAVPVARAQLHWPLVGVLEGSELPKSPPARPVRRRAASRRLLGARRA